MMNPHREGIIITPNTHIAVCSELFTHSCSYKTHSKPMRQAATLMIYTLIIHTCFNTGCPCISEPVEKLGFFILLFYCFFSATLTAYGDSQARVRIRAVAASLRHSHSNTGSDIQAASMTYTIAHGNTRSKMPQILLRHNRNSIIMHFKKWFNADAVTFRMDRQWEFPSWLSG